MGNIKTSFVKRVGKQLFSDHGDKFTKDYTSNKEAIDKLADIKSKKMRNIIAGYVTRLKRQAEQQAP